MYVKDIVMVDLSFQEQDGLAAINVVILNCTNRNCSLTEVADRMYLAVCPLSSSIYFEAMAQRAWPELEKTSYLQYLYSALLWSCTSRAICQYTQCACFGR